MQIIKLGGSVITIKDQPMVANQESINRLSEELKAIWPKPLVLIHGGGSFGHPIAEKYGINKGYKGTRQVYGFARTHQAMVKLNKMIVDTLLENGIPAISLAPSSFITTKDGRISEVDFDIVGQLIVKGALPVLYGDSVLDKNSGFSILSGDQLTVKLAIDMGANRIIFGVDVDGVYTTNPKISTEARLIERLSLEKLRGIVKIGRALTTDVTGGMLGKVQEACVAVEAGIEVLIVNANKKDTILKALRGEPVIGTLLTR